MADYDLSEISDISSYADARADTPTLGEHHSDSEDTLSNLSLEISPDGPLPELPAAFPIPAPRKDLLKTSAAEALSPPTTSASWSFASALNGDPDVKVCVTDADLVMADSLTLDLPPGAHYLPTSVDFPKSPSQLKILKGPSFMPKEEPGLISEDESSVSSYQAQVDLNGQVRLTKKDSSSPPKANFAIPKVHVDEYFPSLPHNLSEDSLNPQDDHDLDDYIEDFILPHSHESVMSRQLSFRRKVQKSYDQIAQDKATQEIEKFEKMLSTYDEEDENNRSITPEALENNFPPVPKSRSQIKPNFQILEQPQSILDIDAILHENAPNLMQDSVSITPHGSAADLESLSNYFLPQQTIDKLYAVYESNNFNNIYCLSGEIKNILTAAEIEEILENKDQLQRFIDPNVMAALSWSLNPASLPPQNKEDEEEVDPVGDLNKLRISTPDPQEEGLKSKSSSMSNGFHSDASSEDDDNSSAQKNKTGKETGSSESGIECPSPTHNLKRGAPLTNSMRRRIAVSKGLKSPTLNDNGRTIEDEDLDPDLDEIDLGVGDEDWEEENPSSERPSSSASGGLCLVRRDSKRFSFKGKDGKERNDQVLEGLFVESKNSNPKGTLRKIRVPLNIGDDNEEEDELYNLNTPSPEPSSLVRIGDESEVKGKKAHRRKLSVDENMFSMVSSAEFEDPDLLSQATNITQSSDIFYSIRNSSKDEEDPTIRTDGGDSEEITLDIDTPDDMEDSIMGQLEQMDTIPQLPRDDGVDDSIRWKSYRVGPTDISIDPQAILPYRKCLSHGGYFDAEKNIAIILFSGCYLPDRSQKDYTYLMDHLFLYVLSTLEELIVEDYMLVYLHGATPKSCVPTYSWLKKCYHLINHRLRKNLKGLYLVHPTFWLRTIVALTRPFVSTKFSRKVQFMNTLSDLCLEIPTEHLVIPDSVLQYDFDLKVDDLKRRKLLS